MVNLLLLAAVVVAAIGVAIKRRGDTGGRNHHGTKPTGYKGGVGRHSGADGGGISGL
jgi:hypothetical protein